MTQATRRYHLNPSTGEPNRCKISPGACDLAQEDNHYPTPELAVEGTIWYFKVKPPKRATTRTLSDAKSAFRRAAIDSLFEHDFPLLDAWRAALKHFDGLCYLCGKVIYNKQTGAELAGGDFKATADHIVPVNLGGSTAPGNIAPAHAICNGQRSSTPIEEFLADNQEMLNRVKNFQKKFGYKPITPEQLNQVNQAIDLIWEGAKAQVVALKTYL